MYILTTTSANRFAEVRMKLRSNSCKLSGWVGCQMHIRPHSGVQKVEYDHPAPTDGFFHDPFNHFVTFSDLGTHVKKPLLYVNMFTYSRISKRMFTYILWRIFSVCKHLHWEIMFSKGGNSILSSKTSKFSACGGLREPQQ